MNTVFKSLPLHEKIAFVVPSDLVSVEGVLEINALLDRTYQRHAYPQLADLGSYERWLNRDWPREWIIAKDSKYVGTFPKRVANFLFKERGIKCEASILSEIGNIARNSCLSVKDFLFDTTDRLIWEEGMFGDDGSCYWSNHAYARQMIKDNGGRALRFFEKDGLTGKARCWLVPLTTGSHVYTDDSNPYDHRNRAYTNGTPELRDQCFILFNGYGYESQRQARILSAYMGLSYHKIELLNEGSYSGMLWINHYSAGDDSTGKPSASYLIGPADLINPVKAVDLMYDSDDSDDSEDDEDETCWNCSTTLYDGQSRQGTDGNAFCLECFNDRFTVCDYCANTVYQDYSSSVNRVTSYGSSREETWCDNCIRNHSVERCQACEELYTETTEINGYHYCRDCLNQCFQHCQGCSEWTRNDQLTQTQEGQEVCEDCLAENYTECEECNAYYREECRFHPAAASA